jgi:hypothetical protein
MVDVIYLSGVVVRKAIAEVYHIAKPTPNENYSLHYSLKAVLWSDPRIGVS